MAGFGLLPPRVDTAADRGRASTHILVDTPESTTVDLRQSTYDIEGLTNRALLVSNAIASPAVRERLAAHAGVPPNEIRTTTPLNAEYPEGVAETGGPQDTSGLYPTSAYRLNVQSDPTVPVIEIDTEAPTPEGAVKLANAAAAGLNSYLSADAGSGAAPPSARLDVVQLGRAQPLVTARGAGPLITTLVFLLVFAAAAATVLFVARVRSGWRASGDAFRANPVS
jgi:hypothetical protein